MFLPLLGLLVVGVLGLFLAGCSMLSTSEGAIRNQGITVKLVIITIPIGPPCPVLVTEYDDPWRGDDTGHTNKQGPP